MSSIKISGKIATGPASEGWRLQYQVCTGSPQHAVTPSSRVIMSSPIAPLRLRQSMSPGPSPYRSVENVRPIVAVSSESSPFVRWDGKGLEVSSG